MVDRIYLADLNRQVRLLIDGIGRPCRHCKNVFEVKGSDDNRIYCKRKCHPFAVKAAIRLEQRQQEAEIRRQARIVARQQKRAERMASTPTYKNCKFCTTQFFYKPLKEFCNPKCRSNYMTLQRQELRPTIPCSKCSKPFKQLHSHYKLCLSCRPQRAEPGSEPKLFRPCQNPTCSNSFRTNNPRKKFCTNTCRLQKVSADVHAQKIARRKPVTEHIRQCTRCNDTFVTTGNFIKCEKHRNNRIPKWEMTCQFGLCGNKFETSTPVQKFCSFACRRKELARTRHEKTIRVRTCRWKECSKTFKKNGCNRYCSPECLRKAKTAAIREYIRGKRKHFDELECTCGNKFTPKRSNQRKCQTCVGKEKDGMQIPIACKKCNNPFLKIHQNQQKFPHASLRGSRATHFRGDAWAIDAICLSRSRPRIRSSVGAPRIAEKDTQ